MGEKPVSAPVQPILFTLKYLTDEYSCNAVVTAGDNTHTGFQLYTRDTVNDPWFAIFRSDTTELTYSDYFGDENTPNQLWQVKTFNADGYSPALDVTILPSGTGEPEPEPETETPTNLIATRRGTANSNLDAQWIDLSWQGALVDGDSWRVVLKDPYGYPQDVEFTTSANTLALEIGQWIDRTIELYPVNTPTNKATLLVLKRPPVRSAPTNLAARTTTLGELTIEFDSDWFWLALNAKPDDNVHQAGLIWYGVYDPVTQTSEPLQSIDPGTIGILGPNRFVLAQPLDPVQQGLQFRVTVEIGSDSGGFSEVIMEEKPAPILALPEGMNNTLTTVTLSKQDDPMEADLFDPFVILLTWAFSDTDNPRAIDVETKIDGSDWKYTGSSAEGYALLSMMLHGQRYSGLDQTGPLDIAFDFLYSDGTRTRDPQPLHTIQARARISGNTADEWIEAPQTLSIPLRSMYHHYIDWLYVNRRNNAEWNSPTIYGENPPGLEKRFSFSIDGDGDYLVQNPRDFIAVVPREFLDGQSHIIGFKTRFITIATGVEHHFIDSAPFSLIFPTRIQLMPDALTSIIPSFKKIRDPFTNLQTGCEFTARLTYDSAMLKAAVSLDNGAFTDVTWSGIGSYPPTVKFNGITIPRDGLSHIVKFKVWHHDSAVNEDSTELLSDSLLATFDMAPPVDPTAVTATLVRDGVGEFPDQVRIEWTSDDPVDIFLIDPDAKKRKLYSADAQESSVVLENARKYGTQNGQPHEYRFGVAAFNRSNYSTTIYATPLTITSGSPATAALTPDEINGTAEKLSQAQLITALDTQLTAVDSAVIAQVLTAALQKIKTVVSKGGSVTLDNVGQFAADWTLEKTAFRNGQYVVVPATRNAAFVPSIGLTKGTKAGLVLSDIEATNLT